MVQNVAVHRIILYTINGTSYLSSMYDNLDPKGLEKAMNEWEIVCW